MVWQRFTVWRVCGSRGGGRAAVYHLDWGCEPAEVGTGMGGDQEGCVGMVHLQCDILQPYIGWPAVERDHGGRVTMERLAGEGIHHQEGFGHRVCLATVAGVFPRGWGTSPMVTGVRPFNANYRKETIPLLGLTGGGQERREPS